MVAVLVIVLIGAQSASAEIIDRILADRRRADHHEV